MQNRIVKLVDFFEDFKTYDDTSSDICRERLFAQLRHTQVASCLLLNIAHKSHFSWWTKNAIHTADYDMCVW